MKRVIYFALPGHTGLNHCRLSRTRALYQLLISHTLTSLLIPLTRTWIDRICQSGIAEPRRWGLFPADGVHIAWELNDTGWTIGLNVGIQSWCWIQSNPIQKSASIVGKRIIPRPDIYLFWVLLFVVEFCIEISFVEGIMLCWILNYINLLFQNGEKNVSFICLNR